MIRISVAQNSVSIEAEASQEDKEQRGGSVHQEIFRGSSSRAITTPELEKTRRTDREID